MGEVVGGQLEGDQDEDGGGEDQMVGEVLGRLDGHDGAEQGEDQAVGEGVGQGVGEGVDTGFGEELHHGEIISQPLPVVNPSL